MKHYRNIKFECKGSVAVVTFNRPEQLNAMNREMMESIIDALAEINENDSIRVGVLTGAGKAFMAGADIKEYAQYTSKEFESFQTLGRNLYSAIEGNSKPIIAAINGYAFGGGLEIALACDMIYAAELSRMGLPEILLNLIPGGGGTQRLPAKIGINRANELLMTGRTVEAEELYQWGLINRLVHRDNFMEESLALAEEIATKHPESIRVLKQLTQVAAGTINQAAQCLENEALGRFYHSEAGQSKIQEFYQASLERERKKAQSS